MANTSTEKLRVAAVQMVSCTNVDDNMHRAAELIAEAASQGAQLVVLPEYFVLMGRKEQDRLAIQEEHDSGPIQSQLVALAKQHSIWLVGGSLPVKSAHPNRPFACCPIYDDQGRRVSCYHKIHLFDVSVADNIGSYRESKHTLPGDQPVVINTPWGKMGVAICYDLRFPELFRALAADFYVIPAAFTESTGRDHWLPLLKARAIENMAAVVASAQGGQHANGRKTWGHSMVVDHWGQVLAQTELGEAVVYAEIDLESQRQGRKAFPALDHRRL